MLPMERIIGEKGLFASPEGARLEMRLPWYRSLPLSTIRVQECLVDGVSVMNGEVFLQVEGETYTLTELEDATDRFWFVLDSAYLLLPRLSLSDGVAYDVALTLALFPPYIAGMKQEITQERRFTI